MAFVILNETDTSDRSEMLEIVRQMERGTVVTPFLQKKNPDKWTLCIRDESRQLICYKLNSKSSTYEETVDIREIKEIRNGKNSRDFDRWPEVASKFYDEQSFVVIYGQEFVLKTLSICAISKDECDRWVKGLRYLANDTINAAYSSLIECWLWKKFFELSSDRTNDRTSVTLKSVQGLLPLINCAMTKQELKQKFVDANEGRKLGSQGRMTFPEFTNLYNELIHNGNLFLAHFRQHSSDNRTIGFNEFKKFLTDQTNPTTDELSDQVLTSFMRGFVGDPRRSIDTPYFTAKEFMCFLFSHHNELWDSTHNTVNQDMTRPLSHYWIATSHNTYLTGDQIKSDSSIESYIRVLNAGCRCVELDCWDGPDGSPIIYHGRTMTSKIRFADVVRAIKENAFKVSEYPVILSIENHCTVPQQKMMAKIFEEEFGDMLLTKPINEIETHLPSPEALRGKIILKDKKLPGTFSPAAVNTLISTEENVDDVSSSEESPNKLPTKGILYMKEEDDWVPFYFMLAETKMTYTEVPEDDEDDSDVEEDPSNEELTEEQMHLNEEWFHGRITGGQASDRAKELLDIHGPTLGDGTFLVRKSSYFVGDYSLSFWRLNQVHHLHIRSRQLDGKTKYYLSEPNYFDSLFGLVGYYTVNPIRSASFNITLTVPVPQSCTHESREWFHPAIARTTSEEILVSVPKEGAFLIRASERDSNLLSLSFRVEETDPDSQEKKIKVMHCSIKREVRVFKIGSLQFDSLNELIAHFVKHPIYNEVKLSYPVTEEVIRECQCRLNQEDGEESAIKCSADSNSLARTNSLTRTISLTSTYSASSTNSITRRNKFESQMSEDDPEDNYLDPRTSTGVTVKAISDYKRQKGDELSFKKNTLILNVTKEDIFWWRGDCGNRKQLLFPSNLVKDCDLNDNEEATVPVIREGNFDIAGADVKIIVPQQISLPSTPSTPTTSEITAIRKRISPTWMLRLKLTTDKIIELGAETEDEAIEWCDTIKGAAKLETANSAELSWSRAKELSDLIVYCRASAFNQERIQLRGRNHLEMSSFSELKAEKSMQPGYKFFVWYHQVMLSRIYPKGLRFDSSNYNPVPFWVFGCQLVALNYQTPDKPMQINQGKFLQNGNCGYVLKPEFMLKCDFNPYYTNPPAGEEPIIITVKIISAQHLIIKSKKGIASPYVEVEIIGTEQDQIHNKHITRTTTDNGFNPVWNETAEFDVSCPSLSLIRFAVYDNFDKDMFGEAHLIAQATYPVKCIRRGFRSIPLKNGFSELLELAALVVHVDIKKRMDEESDALLRRLKREGDRERIRTQRSRARAEADDPYSLLTFHPPHPLLVNLASSDPQTEGRGLQPLAMSTIPEDNDENEYSEISTVAETAAAVSNGHDEHDSESTDL